MNSDREIVSERVNICHMAATGREVMSKLSAKNLASSLGKVQGKVDILVRSKDLMALMIGP